MCQHIQKKLKFILYIFIIYLYRPENQNTIVWEMLVLHYRSCSPNLFRFSPVKRKCSSLLILTSQNITGARDGSSSTLLGKIRHLERRRRASTRRRDQSREPLCHFPVAETCTVDKCGLVAKLLTRFTRPKTPAPVRLKETGALVRLQAEEQSTKKFETICHILNSPKEAGEKFSSIPSNYIYYPA
jgi:hypothetical protein